MSAPLVNYTNSRDNNFNLIRFVAASLVLYSHSYALSTGSGENEPLRSFTGLASMTWGSVAVDLFFITSGFLIAGSFFGRKSIVAFIWARVLRIYPALIISVLFCVFGVGLYFTNYNSFDFLSDETTIRFLIKNTTLFFGTESRLPGVFTDAPYKYAVNGSLWTLPYEVKMYVLLMIFGLAILYLKSLIGEKILPIFFLCIALLSVVTNIANHFIPVTPIIFTRLFSMFFVGVAFYIYREKIVISSKFAFIAISAMLISSLHSDALVVVYGLVFAYIIFWAAYVPSGIIRKFNDMGDFSYGIYIYAFPVQQSLAMMVPNISILNMAIYSFGITFILAFFSWHLIEKHALKLKKSYLYFESVVELWRKRKLPNLSI
ncbi:MAG: acyltransferase [Halioglobus sp.]